MRYIQKYPDKMKNSHKNYENVRCNPFFLQVRQRAMRKIMQARSFLFEEKENAISKPKK